MVRHIHNFSSDTVQITPRVPLHKSENSKNQLRQLQSLVLIIQKQILTKCTSIIGTSELLRFTTRSHGIRNFSLPTWNELHTITKKKKKNLIADLIHIKFSKFTVKKSLTFCTDQLQCNPPVSVSELKPVKTRKPRFENANLWSEQN